MNQPQNSGSAEAGVPRPEHGKMPKWLFFMWVAFLLWGAYYLVRYALPDLKIWSAKPLPTGYQRAN